MARDKREADMAISSAADVAERLPRVESQGPFGPGYTGTPNEVKQFFMIRCIIRCHVAAIVKCFMEVGMGTLWSAFVK